jgi:hypothetical protein
MARDRFPEASPATVRAFRSGARALVWAVVVLAGTAAALRTADAVPGLLGSTSRGVVRYATLAEVERVTGRPLPAPGYYPSTLEWPPSDLRVYLGQAASYWCRARADGVVSFAMATTPAGQASLTRAVLPPADVLQEADATVGGRTVRVTRLRDANGALWQQAEWTGLRGVTVVRYRGTLDEMMRMVSSLKE